MKSIRFDVIVAAIIVALIISACQKENQPPTIQSFTAEPDSVYPGDTISINYSTGDDDMEHVWQYLNARQGVLFLHGNVGPPILPVHWVAPEQSGDYYFHLRITDGKSSVEDSISVHVMDTIGSFVDPRDNHEYKWVKIGSQIWMAENLAYLPTVSSSYTGSVLEKHYYVYGYEGTSVASAKSEDNYGIYGVLYNWEAAMSSCPPGWKLPSDEEWKTLERYLGMNAYHVDEKHDRTSGDVGKKLKSLSGWIQNGNGTNSNHFDLLPAGRRGVFMENGQIVGFGEIGYHSFIWSSSEEEEGHYQGWCRSVSGNRNDIDRFFEPQECGHSVRCIKDE